jgi:hypothetical protein
MNSTDDLGTEQIGFRGKARDDLLGLVITGLVGALEAMVATTVIAALAKSVGIDFEIPDGGQPIPLPAFAIMTAVFSLVGIALAAAMLRWAARPASRFVRTAVVLTALSLLPPVLSGADIATATALLGLHLVAAAVMIPTLGCGLRRSTRCEIGEGAVSDA